MMSGYTHYGTNTLSYFLGTMYDVVQAAVVILLYVTSVITVINAIRERCKNRFLIIVCIVAGTSLQTVYLVAPYRAGFLDVGQSYSYVKGNVSDSLTGIRSHGVNGNDFSFNKHMDNKKVMTTKFDEDVLLVQKQSEPMTAGKHSNRKDDNMLQDIIVQNTATPRVSSTSKYQNFPDFQCADLRLIALTHYGAICILLLLASVKQNVSQKRQNTVRCGVFIYVVILIGVIAILYELKTSDNHDIFSMGTASDIFQLVVCSQDARSQFVPILLETVCLFGPSIGMLLLFLYKKTGFHVFKECRTANTIECRACSGLDDILLNVLLCFVFVLLFVRPLHYIFTYVKHTQFYDIWVIACVIILYATISVTNVVNIISSKIYCNESVPIEKEKSCGEKKDIIDLL